MNKDFIRRLVRCILAILFFPLLVAYAPFFLLLDFLNDNDENTASQLITGALNWIKFKDAEI